MPLAQTVAPKYFDLPVLMRFEVRCENSRWPKSVMGSLAVIHGRCAYVRSYLKADIGLRSIRYDVAFLITATSIFFMDPPTTQRSIRLIRSERYAYPHAGAALRQKPTATSTTQWFYSSVSKASLHKTGVFLDSAGDFWECSAQKVRTSVSRDFSR